MNIEIKKGENSVFIAKITIPEDQVSHHLEHALEHEAKHVEIKGFRKGKAPLNLVKEKIDPAKLRSHALNHILPESYSTVIKEHKIVPIIDPRFEIVQFEDGKELIFNIHLVERPLIKLKDYKSALKKKFQEKVSKAEKDQSTDLTNEEIVEIIKENSEVGLAELLIEDETNRMLDNLVQQLEKLGIQLDKYLESIKKTAEEVRKEYLEIAKNTLHADFALTQIAIDENFQVSDEEIQKTIDAVQDEKSRELLGKPEQRAYIRAVLSKSKTLDNLAKATKESISSQKEK